ncbi:MAG: CDP-alcohol phosphatidyltransferase family protein, partial [Victivallales bacterium]|nr:CDP-alcohol phosphatidyltransferase family protein [Victivallales bacterium]
WQALLSHYVLCMVLVFVGQFFDLFDGRLARKYGSTKRGPLFDDIADATSFGLAIGTMIFKCMVKNTAFPVWLAALLALFYVVCLIYRLYRFLKPTEKLPRGIFQGTPSPAGAMLAGSSILAALAVGQQWAMYLAAALVLISACLMVSNVHYCHFGQVILPQIPRGVKLLIAILVIILTVMAIAMKYYRPAFVWTCFCGSIVYMLCGMQKVNRLSCPETNASGEEAQ